MYIVVHLRTKFISSFVVLWLVFCTNTKAKMSSSMLESILLINLQELKEISVTNDNQNRRSSLNPEQIQSKIEETPLPDLPDSLTGGFEATHGPPVETNKMLTQSLSDGFALESPPSIEDFIASLNNLVGFKDGTTMSNQSFLSALKSMISAYLRAGGNFDNFKDLPSNLYGSILPKINMWDGGTVALWIKNISQISIEAFLDEGRSMEELSDLASSFASTTVDLISNPSPLADQLELNDLDLDYLNSSDNITLEDKIFSGKNYSPTKTNLLQQLSVGISQGYFGFMDFDDDNGLTKEDFENFSEPESIPNSSNGGKVDANIITSFMDGLLDSTITLGETKEVFLYDSIKAAANGFLISSTVAATSNPKYLDEKLYLDVAEMLSMQISQSVLLHNYNELDGSVAYTMALDWVEVDRVAESAASGSAMGSQLATVLPNSLDYSDSWEIATNIRREIAKSVSSGSSSGSINTSAWLSSVIDPQSPNETVVDNQQVEKVSRGSALGSMMGNTGLAIYYPTDQLVPIINFTAQGSAYGSTNARNLAIVELDSVESIDVGVARQSALGSSMAAIFEPTVLLGLSPEKNSKDQRTIDHLTAAAFGATFGAMLGLQENVGEIISGDGTSQFEEPRVIELQQATKQGAIEGALAGAKLSLGLDDINTETLKSKTAMLKAVNNANMKAAANSTSNVVNQSLRTNPQDMLLLMKKFGINPRYTNPAKMYKRPVIVQIDEPPIDDEASDAINNASPL